MTAAFHDALLQLKALEGEHPTEWPRVCYAAGQLIEAIPGDAVVVLVPQDVAQAFVADGGPAEVRAHQQAENLLVRHVRAALEAQA